MLIVDAHALPRSPRLDATTVQGNGRHRRRRRRRRLPPVMEVVRRLPVALLLHLRADLLGQAVDVPAADVNVAHQLYDLRGHPVRFHFAGGADDLVQ